MLFNLIFQERTLEESLTSVRSQGRHWNLFSIQFVPDASSTVPDNSPVPLNVKINVFYVFKMCHFGERTTDVSALDNGL